MSKIIQVCGTSGTGKSTIFQSLSSRLESDGYQVTKIVEPGPLRELAKSYRLRRDGNPWTEAAIFATDRIMTYDALMPLSEDQKAIYLSERGIADSLVYQGLVEGIPIEILLKLNQNIPKPDLVICLTVNGIEGHRRVVERNTRTGERLSPNESADRIDLLGRSYMRLPSFLPTWNIKLLDTTNKRPEEVLENCYRLTREL